MGDAHCHDGQESGRTLEVWMVAAGWAGIWVAKYGCEWV